SAAIVPDHKLYVVPCETADEAEWLAEVINSPLVDSLARAFAINTSISGSLLRYIGIKRLTGERPDTPLRQLQMALGLKRPELQLLLRTLGLSFEDLPG